MAVARKDENSVSSWIGVSCVDGVTPIRITINPATGGFSVDTTTVISFTPDPKQATIRDANQVPVKTGVSSTNSSVILPLYVNPATGAILIST